ncbi:MAG: DUF63 family protein [Candidatus Hydrothermarchaeaceae archaeon]
MYLSFEEFAMASYAPQDYLVYFAILLAILWFFSNIFFKRIKFDDKFLLLAAPYIVLGVALRMLPDVGVVERSQLWNITPGVYIVTIAAGLVSVGLGLLVKRLLGIEYWKFPLAIGTLLALFAMYNIANHVNHPVRILYPFGLAAVITGVIYLASGASSTTAIFRRRSNIAIIFAHLLDGSATFIGIDFYRFTEEHLLPDYLISLAGSAFVMIPLKIVVVLPVLYFVEKWRIDEGEGKTQEYYILKFVLFILGFGPGLRDAILPGTLV